MRSSATFCRSALAASALTMESYASRLVGVRVRVRVGVGVGVRVRAGVRARVRVRVLQLSRRKLRAALRMLVV